MIEIGILVVTRNDWRNHEGTKPWIFQKSKYIISRPSTSQRPICGDLEIVIVWFFQMSQRRNLMHHPSHVSNSFIKPNIPINLIKRIFQLTPNTSDDEAVSLNSSLGSQNSCFNCHMNLDWFLVSHEIRLLVNRK